MVPKKTSQTIKGNFGLFFLVITGSLNLGSSRNRVGQSSLFPLFSALRRIRRGEGKVDATLR